MDRRINEGIIDLNERKQKINEENIHVLEQVKDILTIKETDFATVQMCAEYFEVSERRIRQIINEINEELKNYNKNLEDNYKLTKTKISKLIQMGWSLDKKITDNYIRKMRANTDEERSVIAEEVVLAFVEVYGTSNADSIEATLVT